MIIGKKRWLDKMTYLQFLDWLQSRGCSVEQVLQETQDGPMRTWRILAADGVVDYPIAGHPAWIIEDEVIDEVCDSLSLGAQRPGSRHTQG